MIFLTGSTLLGCDEMSITISPTNISDITVIELMNTWFDDLYVTENTNEGLPSIDPITHETRVPDVPEEWDWNTVMHARFNDSTSAGNVDWDINTLSHLLIKRKLATENVWQTIRVQAIEQQYDNLSFNGRDLIPGNGLYEYALVPVTGGTIEGLYIRSNIEIELKQLIILDSTAIWRTPFLDQFDIQYVVPSSAVETLYDRYPFIISNTNANYRTITLGTQFYPINEEGCDINDMDDNTKRITYVDRFFEFLHNRKVKLIKMPTGRIFLVYITTPASLSLGESDIIENISLGATEVGSVNDEETMYYAGLIDPSVTEEWWNN